MIQIQWFVFEKFHCAFREQALYTAKQVQTAYISREDQKHGFFSDFPLYGEGYILLGSPDSYNLEIVATSCDFICQKKRWIVKKKGGSVKKKGGLSKKKVDWPHPRSENAQ